MSEATPQAEDRGARPRPRGIHLVPAALTIGNIFVGYFAIVQAFQGRFERAALLLLVALFLDKVDGMIARATGTTSDFGRELDSLADVISFGVAPPLLALSWGLGPLGRLGAGAAFVWLMCGSLRLARFNVQAGSIDKRFFVGLPIPMAASVPVTIIFAVTRWRGDAPIEDARLSWLFLGLLLLVAFLMVSRVRYFAFKEVHVARHRRLWVLLGIVLVIAAIASYPGPVLLLLSGAYAVHGPLLRLISAGSRRRAPAGPAAAAGGDGGEA